MDNTKRAPRRPRGKRPVTPPDARIWGKVDKRGPVPVGRPELGNCWQWRGGATTGGYGRIRVDGSAGTMVYAHRVTWELANGSVPAGLLPLHHCGNRRCVNPAHLFLGTRADIAPAKITMVRACASCQRDLGHRGKRARFCSMRCARNSGAWRNVSIPLTDRFWSKVNKWGPTPSHAPGLGACWVWTAGAHEFGYGKIGRPGGGSEYAHRLSWVMHNGEIRGGLEVLHQCDNPRCVRPAHLFLGTKQDNLRDMRSKGRGGSGESHGHTRLTLEQVRDLRSLYDSGVGPSELGRKFGCTAGTACNIGKRKSWKYVT
jgi:hypothetical protein